MSGAIFQMLLASGGKHVPAISFLGAAAAGSGSFALGPEDPSRIIVFVAYGGQTGATLNGVAMTPLSVNSPLISMYVMALPTGTSAASFVASGGFAPFCAAYALYGMSGAATFALQAGGGSVSLSVPANGIVVSIFGSNNAVSFTAGVTQDASAGAPGAASGHAGPMAATTITVSGTGGGGASQRIIAASWGP